MDAEMDNVAADILRAPETSDNLQNQARHYKIKARPNKKDVAQLLNLDNVTKEQDRLVKILEGYSCFGVLDHG